MNPSNDEQSGIPPKETTNATPVTTPTLKATAKEFVPGGGFKPPVAIAPQVVPQMQQVPVYAYGQMSYVPAQVNNL